MGVGDDLGRSLLRGGYPGGGFAVGVGEVVGGLVLGQFEDDFDSGAEVFGGAVADRWGFSAAGGRNERESGSGGSGAPATGTRMSVAWPGGSESTGGGTYSGSGAPPAGAPLAGAMATSWPGGPAGATTSRGVRGGYVPAAGNAFCRSVGLHVRRLRRWVAGLVSWRGLRRTRLGLAVI